MIYEPTYHARRAYSSNALAVKTGQPQMSKNAIIYKSNDIYRMSVALASMFQTHDLGEVLKFTPVSGGSINETYCVKTAQGMFFLKQNRHCPADFFQKEADGLQRLSSFLKVPKIIAVDEHYLILEYLELYPPMQKVSENAGKQLANLHLKTLSNSFGLETNNYMGAVAQKNDMGKSGNMFYIQNRWENLYEQCSGYFNVSDYKMFQKFLNKVEVLLPDENPCLLHGDLWSGNYAGVGEEACFFDPAVYYGFREADIAMTKLFGGFSQAFYDAYQAMFPLSKGWEERILLFQLYPLLIHVKLFGVAYVGQVRSVLQYYA